MANTAPVESNGRPHVRTSEGVVLKVGANSPAPQVAGAISQSLFDSHKVKIRAIGAGAVNQAIKACAIARSHTASRGFDLAVIPGFEVQEGKDGEISVMTLRIMTY